MNNNFCILYDEIGNCIDFVPFLLNNFQIPKIKNLSKNEDDMGDYRLSNNLNDIGSMTFKYFMQVFKNANRRSLLKYKKDFMRFGFQVKRYLYKNANASERRNISNYGNYAIEIAIEFHRFMTPIERKTIINEKSEKWKRKIALPII